MKTLAATLIVVGLAGCVEDDLELGQTEQHAGPGTGGTRGGQGPRAMSSNLDGEAGAAPGFHLSTSATGTKSGTPTTFGVSGTCLTSSLGSCAAPAIVGHAFPASNGATYTIVGSIAFTTEQGTSTTGYQLRNASGVELCPAAAGPHLAYPLAGELRTDGVAFATPRLSWACSEYLVSGARDAAVAGNGVLAKALAWGLLPGGTYTNVGGVQVSGLELAQTAMRMGRADYCYNGTNHSLENTSISFLDTVPGNALPEATQVDPDPTMVTPPTVIDSTQYHFEAAWAKPQIPSAGGDLGRPLCFSRLRWQSLPLGDRCGATLRDPRLNQDVKFCEDWTWTDLVTAGAMLVNASQRNDAGLIRWRHATNGDHYTTTVGAWNGVRPSNLPAPSYNARVLTPLLLGTLLTVSGKSVFEANFAPAVGGVLAPLQSCKKSGGTDWLTTKPGSFPGGYVNCKTEGFLWTTPPAASVTAALGWTMIPLKRYQKGTEHITTTGAGPAGYTLVETVGHIVGPATW